MSRIGKKPVVIPAGVNVSVDGNDIIVKGPKGNLSKPLHQAVSIDVADNEVTVSPATESKLSSALWGTYASHLNNMMVGVTEGFTRRLIIEGVGYRAAVEGKKLVMQLGYSHPIEMELPEGIEAAVEKNIIILTGSDKDAMGQFAADIRSKRKPEPYKGKGIRYENEVIRRKEGKKSA